jgi:hypothetical protein
VFASTTGITVRKIVNNKKTIADLFIAPYYIQITLLVRAWNL